MYEVSAGRIIDLTFFQETVNSDRQVRDILNWLFNQLTAEGRQYRYFQQDHITEHTANKSMTIILVHGIDVFKNNNKQRILGS